MKKIWQMGLTAFLAVFLLAACGTTATEDKPKVDETPKAEEVKADFPLTLTDAIDNEITVEKAPATIVSMIPSNTEILFELGLADEVVGVSDFDDYPAEVLEKEKIGGQEFSVEKIIALNPEIVFAHESALGMGVEGLQQIRDAGIPVFVVKNAASFDETYTTIETIGKATGKTVEAEKIISDMKAKVEEVIAKTANVENKKTVLFETSPAPHIYTPGKNTFMDQMLAMINAENIAADQEDWFEIASEEIVNRNPDVILVSYDFVETVVADVYARPGFDSITAIQEKAVVQVDENITSRTGPRLADGLEELAKAIYPEAFSE